MGVTVLGIQHNFYPRSPCGERQLAARDDSILFVFLSTLSLRRATALSLPFGAVWVISIHALLAESDVNISLALLALGDFYPRSPCGERPDSLTDDVSTGGFLSTLSLRRATGR